MSPTKLHDIEVEVDGIKYSGQYSDDGKVLTVFSSYGNTSTHSGPHMARRLLRELIEGAKKSGRL